VSDAGLVEWRVSLSTTLAGKPERRRALVVVLASLLAMDRTTLTAALKPLQRRGLVQISADPADRRSRILKLTKTGRKLLAEAIRAWKSAHEEVERLLPDGDPEGLRRGLRALG